MRRLNSRAAFDNLRAAQDFIFTVLSLYSMQATGLRCIATGTETNTVGWDELYRDCHEKLRIEAGALRQSGGRKIAVFLGDRPRILQASGAETR